MAKQKTGKRQDFGISLIATGLCDLGVRSLSAYLKEKGYRTRVLFLNNNRRDYSRQALYEVGEVVKDSGIICISLLSLNIEKTKQLTNFLKKFKKPVIWGGCLVTTKPELCIEYTDILCIGEGEKALFDFAEKVRKGKNFFGTKNFWFRKDGLIIKNPPRPLIKNLDTLQFPEFIGKHYFLENGRISTNIENSFFCDHIVYGKQKAVFVYSQRGCVHNCSYCSNSKYRELYKGQCYIRRASIKRLIEQLAEIKKKLHGLEYIYIYDDDFFGRPLKDIKEFSGKYSKLIGLPFHAYSTPATMDEEKLRLLISAGLKDIDMGIQTGSERINKELFNRGNHLNKEVFRAARVLNKYKKFLNPPLYDFILNNPFETDNDLLETIGLLKKLPKPYFLFGHSLVFIPGTKLYEKGVNERMIKDSFDLGMVETWLNPFAYFLKRKRNIYLNSLMCMMWGPITKKKYGIIPSQLIPLLTNKSVVRFMNLLSPFILLLGYAMPTPNRIYHLKKKLSG